MSRSIELVATLTSADKPTETWSSPDGSAALVFPYGGRILGLFAPESEQNFFWTHPALDAEETARDFYKSAQWHNSGGDRTWLAPEVDFFFPNFPKAIGGLGGERACEDASQVWAFRGRREDILEAARMLISSDV